MNGDSQKLRMNGAARERDIRAESEAFSAKNADSGQEHIALSGDLPLPMGIGFRILPGNAKGAVRFIIGKVADRAREHW